MTDRPRESDPTDRPSDAVTGKVVARKHGIDSPDGTRIMVEDGMILHDPPGGHMREWTDPRDDDQATMELLWALETRLHPIHSISKGEGWLAIGYGCDQQEFIPISGEPFRYAVVRLAARVWGVE